MGSEGHPADPDDTFCVMPFVHLHIAQDGAVLPCCQAPTSEALSFGNINRQSIAEIWNGPGLQQFRRKMRAGDRDERCAGCYSKEAEGFMSLRRVSNDKYAGQISHIRAQPEDPAPMPEPVYIDVRFSNHCNFRCRICGPTSSSAWHQDAVALGWLPRGSPARSRITDDPVRLWQQLRDLAPHLQEVYFAGGEPLLMEEHYQLLEMFIELGNSQVRLQYNSNFSVLDFKSWDATDLWRQFTDVTVSASLDGMGARGEYQRSNQRWADVLVNRELLRRKAPHVRFLITPAVSLFNVLHLPEFNRAAVDDGLIGAFDFIPSLLVRPAEYSIRTLPSDLKAKARQQIEVHLAWLETQSADAEQRGFVLRQWASVLRHMDAGSSAHLIPDFLTKTAALDRLRGESWLQVFPELAGLTDTATASLRGGL